MALSHLQLHTLSTNKILLKREREREMDQIVKEKTRLKFPQKFFDREMLTSTFNIIVNKLF